MISLFEMVPIYSVSIFLSGPKKGRFLVLSDDKVTVDEQGCGIIRKRTAGIDYLLVLSTKSQKDAIRKAVLAFGDHESGRHIFKYDEFYKITDEAA